MGISKIREPVFVMDGHQIAIQKSIRYLGVELDTRPKNSGWEGHESGIGHREAHAKRRRPFPCQKGTIEF